ncbi:MAG: CPBP family intramembrane glutamic endopeptidase, partial [Cyanobacteriota bacterium]|nr:CPBP family intramembrane glutamic endopeptidase [Cyanobacteriota bacterium]
MFGKRPRRRQLLLLLLVVPLFLLSLGSGQVLLLSLTGIFPNLARSLWKENLLASAANTPVPIAYTALLVILLIFVAPAIEELLFRGLILQRLATRWGLTVGIVFSSLLFGILHVNFIGLSIFGLAMAVLYLQTRTLWLP